MISKLIQFLIIYLVSKLFTKYSTEDTYELINNLNIKYGITVPETITESIPVVAIEPEVKTIVFTRMEQEVFEHLERNVGGNCIVTATTSDIESGFKLGVQHVLNKLRVGYVITRG